MHVFSLVFGHFSRVVFGLCWLLKPLPLSLLIEEEPEVALRSHISLPLGVRVSIGMGHVLGLCVLGFGCLVLFFSTYFDSCHGLFIVFGLGSSFNRVLSISR